jgi:hypothetical protein
VSGDLQTNWGDTPPDLIPLFMLMEEASKIEGSARLFAVIAYRESRFVTTAHNGNANEQDERDSSRAAYTNNKDRNPPLKYGEQAAEFGSGGLFGLLAPYLPVDRRPRDRQACAAAERAARAGVPAARCCVRRRRVHAAPPRQLPDR